MLDFKTNIFPPLSFNEFVISILFLFFFIIPYNKKLLRINFSKQFYLLILVFTFNYILNFYFLILKFSGHLVGRPLFASVSTPQRGLDSERSQQLVDCLGGIQQVVQLHHQIVPESNQVVAHLSQHPPQQVDSEDGSSYQEQDPDDVPRFGLLIVHEAFEPFKNPLHFSVPPNYCVFLHRSIRCRGRTSMQKCTYIITFFI